MPSSVEFNVRTSGDIVLLEFKLARPIEPKELKRMELPEIPHGKLLLITGRGPIWLYGFLVHHYAHLAKAVGVYDPKIPGFVIVASHYPEREPGDVIEFAATS